MDRRTALVALGLTPVARRPSAKINGHPGQVGILPQDFGAVSDGATDDTEAMQAAIDACLNEHPPRALLLSGLSRITKPLTVRRRVDATRDEFLIRGNGGGFLLDSSFTLFTDGNETEAIPTSEFLTFDGVHFEASDPNLEAFCFSQSFLRMKLLNCYFLRIKALASRTYAQSWAFRSCNIRSWKGVFFATHGHLYDCDWTGNIFEFGEDGIRSEAGGAVGTRLVNNLFEGSRTFYQQASGHALTIIGNYHEQNSGPDHVLTDMAAKGVVRVAALIGNFFQRANPEAAVLLGDVRGFHSAGNYCNGALFDMRGYPTERVSSSGDYAELALFVGHDAAK